MCLERATGCVYLEDVGCVSASTIDEEDLPHDCSRFSPDICLTQKVFPCYLERVQNIPIQCDVPNTFTLICRPWSLKETEFKNCADFENNVKSTFDYSLSSSIADKRRL